MSKSFHAAVEIFPLLLRRHCSYAVLSIDAMDVSGEQQLDVDHNMFKQRIDLQGQVISEQPIKEGKRCRLGNSPCYFSVRVAVYYLKITRQISGSGNGTM